MAGITIARVKRQNETKLALLGEVVKTSQEKLTKLTTAAVNRIEFRNMEQAMATLGKHCRAGSFDPTRQFQHVANFDNEVWLLILELFARYDDATGELMDDGLLYKYDEDAGCLKLNKPFFYGLVDYFESIGVPCDMRGRIKIA